MRVEWEAIRLNKWPDIPSTDPWVDDDSEIAFVPSGRSLSVRTQLQSADGRKYAHVIKGSVDCLMSRPFIDGEEMRFVPIPPTVSGETDADDPDPVDRIPTPVSKSLGQFSISPPPADPGDP